VLLISGSLREASTNSAALRTVRAVTPDNVVTTISDDLVDLPHFNPDDDGDDLAPAVQRLRARIDAADAVLFCTPEYAGALPGSFKNLLDWTVGGVEINDKPVAWINVSTSGAVLAHESLRHVLGYVGADIVESACRAVPVPRQVIGSDGTIDDPDIRAQLGEVVRALAEHVAARTSADQSA
jgi:NAD(P)H-dependent FMN reductase